MDFLGSIDLGLLAVIIGILFVGASAIFGWMIFYWARSRQKEPLSPSEERPSPSSSMPSPSTSEKRGKAQEPLEEQDTTLRGVDRVARAATGEVMSLLRDRVTGELIVEVEGKKYRALREIKDGRVGRQVLQTAADLVRFTEVTQPQKRTQTQQTSYTSNVEPVPTNSFPAPSTHLPTVATGMEPGTPVPRTPAPPSVEQEFLESLSRQTPEKKEPAKISPSPLEFFRRGFAARRTARLQDDLPSPHSFVKEIEDILQRFIRTYPSFVGQEVHVGTSPEGGIRIQVENDFYDTPDDIPNPEIRGLIKAAIQEWEKS
jgi:hypothetical protein